MKMRKALPVMVLAATVLTGCAKEVAYADFHAKAIEVKNSKYISAVAKVKGTYVSDGQTTNVDDEIKYTVTLGIWTPDKTGLIALLTSVIVNEKAALVGESSDLKYYLDGDEFKTVSESTTKRYDEYGFIYRLDYKAEGSDYTIKVNWHESN